jgi:pimeloyl-ACP methyl ester carboxylesterase
MEKVISKDGTSIAFDRYGTGPALILIGGAMQQRAVDPQTALLAKILAQHFTVFHYDRRGRGDSGDTLPYAVEREIEDLDALIHAAGGSAHLYGMSSGAGLALEAAASRLAIARMALYEAPYNTMEYERAESEEYTAQLNELLAEGRRGDAVIYTLSSFGLPDEAAAGMQQSPAWPHFKAAAHTLAYDNAVMGDGFVPVERLASIQVPTLVIVGAESPPYMHNATQVLLNALPNAQHRTLEGQTHDVDPRVIAPVLTAFYSA